MIKLKYLKDRSIVKIKNSNKLECRGRIRLSKIRVSGRNNKLIIGEGSRINQANIVIKGENNIVIIEEKCDLNLLNITMENKNALISIGTGTTCGKTHIVSLEPYDIIIGKNCMISYDVEIRNTDSHKMLDNESKNWINKGKAVNIADNVWIATRALILKGSTIEKDSIVGAGSIVNKKFNKNSLIAGVPAITIKEGVSWNRDEVFREYE